MTPNDKLAQLERAFEQRLIDLSRATDGAGLKVMITPTVALPKGAHPLSGSLIPTPAQFRDKILGMVAGSGEQYIGYRAEEAAARNVALLAKAWEAAVRYWDFQRELTK